VIIVAVLGLIGTLADNGAEPTATPSPSPSAIEFSTPPPASPSPSAESASEEPPDVVGRVLRSARVTLEGQGWMVVTSPATGDTDEASWTVTGQSRDGLTVTLEVAEKSGDTSAPSSPATTDQAAAMEAALKQQFSLSPDQSWTSLCGTDGIGNTDWPCLVNGFEYRSGILTVTLQEPEISKEYAAQAERAVFGLIGKEFPNLEWVTTKNSSGVEVSSGTKRSDVPLLNLDN
jgi:hypothetical protein